MFFSPFSIAITSLGEERANLSAFRTFVRFVLVWFCRFPLPLGVWEGLRFVDCGTPWTFLLPFFLIRYGQSDQIFSSKIKHQAKTYIRVMSEGQKKLFHIGYIDFFLISQTKVICCGFLRSMYFTKVC